MCISLYKRVFPKWPAATAVKAGAWQQQVQGGVPVLADVAGSSIEGGGAPPGLGMASFA